MVNRVPLEIEKKYNKLTILRESETRTKNHNVLVWCQCDCGVVKEIRVDHVRRSITKSCGCYKKECHKNRKPLGTAAFNEWLHRTKSGALRRNYSWELSEEQFRHLGGQNCYYCQAPPRDIYNKGRYHGDYVCNGIDRVDNTKGYTIENCVPCCKTCNIAKHTMTLEEFSEWAIRLGKHLENRKNLG